MVTLITVPTIVCMFHCPHASVVELVPGIARHVIMSRHTCISVCIMKHILKQQKNIHLQVSHQPRWALWWVVTAGTRSMAEVPQKMLSGARACTMPSAACHPSFPRIQWHFSVPHRPGVSATLRQTWIDNYTGLSLYPTNCWPHPTLFFWPMTLCLPCYPIYITIM